MRRVGIICVFLALSAGLAACDYLPDFLRALLERPDIITSKAFEKGAFKGELDVRFMSSTSGDGYPVEIIQLLQPFGYKDSNGVEWDVPAGTWSDGASIPSSLWLIVGGPFSGPYRDAAVIHDYYCDIKSRKWEDVHSVFLEAALKRGTRESLAKYMYAAILYAGPRWPAPKTGLRETDVIKAQVTPTPSPPPKPAPTPPPVRKSDKEVFEELKAWIEREKPTLEQIKKRVQEIKTQQQSAPK